MEIYIITIFSPDKDKEGKNKSKTMNCISDLDLFVNIQSATDANCGYIVYKATEVLNTSK